MILTTRAIALASSAILVSSSLVLAETNDVGKAPTGSDRMQTGTPAVGAPNEAGAPASNSMGANAGKMDQGASGKPGFVGTGSSEPTRR